MTKLSSKEKISKTEYYQLLGMKVLAQRHIKMIEELESAVYEITGELEHDGKPTTWGGHGSDFLWDSRELDSMLDILGIKVENE